MQIVTADLYDEHGDALQSCSLQFRQYGRRLAFHGLVATVSCHEDNALLKNVLSEPATAGFWSSTARAPSTPRSWATRSPNSPRATAGRA